MLRPAVLHIVAVDGGDDDVVQPQLGDRVGHAPRFEDVQRLGRLAGRDVAEGAGTGTDLAHDHHGGVALAPAFADVGAACLLADRDQLVFAHDPRGLGIALHRRVP